MNKHESLISNLSSNLAPVSPPPNINRLALGWFALAAIFVVAVTQLIDPIRPGALSQLGAEPRFLLETMSGVAAILWFSLLAFRSAIPAALTRQFGCRPGSDGNLAGPVCDWVYQPHPGTIRAG